MMGQAKKTLKKLVGLVRTRQQARLGVLEHSVGKEGPEPEAMRDAYLLICELSDLINDYWSEQAVEDALEEDALHDPPEGGDERWKFIWEAVGYGPDRDAALANARQWVDLNDPKGEALVGHKPEPWEEA